VVLGVVVAVVVVAGVEADTELLGNAELTMVPLV
jgi:hypothetical protein